MPNEEIKKGKTTLKKEGDTYIYIYIYIHSHTHTKLRIWK
jgi:hypothetical protein